MTQKQFTTLSPAARVEWLDKVSPTGTWKFGDDIFCHHCDAVFKAEDVACDPEGDPTCPLCHNATPLDFHHLPWWREDLTKFADDGDGYETNYAWAVKPITATPGKPRQLPKQKKVKPENN